MTKFELKINSRLEIKTNESVFNSTIQNINEDSFFISIPMEKGYYVKFENGERLTVYCYWENTSVYKFESKVLGREKCGNMPLYKLTLPEKVEKIQRREYVRINVISPIEIISKDKKGHGLLLDISGGGMKITTEEKLSKEDLIDIKLKSLESGQEIIISGSVVRANRDEKGRNIYGIRYYNIENKIREKIIQSIFTIMRKQKKTN